MYLLDTNVVSELRKEPGGRADANVAAWSRTVSADALFLSVVTVHEIEFGIRRVEQTDRDNAAVLRSWLRDFVLPAFGKRILAIDVPIAMRSAELHAVRTRNWQDALLSATALLHDLVLITRNVRYFDNTGVSLLNPWEA